MTFLRCHSDKSGEETVKAPTIVKAGLNRSVASVYLRDIANDIILLKRADPFSRHWDEVAGRIIMRQQESLPSGLLVDRSGGHAPNDHLSENEEQHEEQVRNFPAWHVRGT